MDQHTSVSTIDINAPATRVWEALTAPDLVKRWQYGADLITTWVVGSPISFRSEWDGAVYEQRGTVLAVEEPRRVSYTLFAPRPGQEDTPANRFTMTYTLDERDGQTRLTITQDDPRERPEGDARDDDEQGAAILQGLKALVEGMGAR